MKKCILALITVLFSSCTSSYSKKIEENKIISKKWGLQEIKIIYNYPSNALIGNTILVRNLGDVSIFLHEYAHAIHDFHLKPSEKLVFLLSKEWPVPPRIIPTYNNRELQDFITTSTRWKIEYPFKHKKDCLIVNEQMANLFVIFTQNREDKDYIRKYYNEIYKEYEKYYNALDKNIKKGSDTI